MASLYRTPQGRERVRDWCTSRLEAWATPHETTSISTSVGPVHLVSAGSGPLTLVYLPGTSFNAATGLPLLTALAARCRVLAMDLPGQPGLSTANRPRGGDTDTGWLSEVLAAVGRGPVVLVGHSRGAHVALCTDPSSVTGAVLVDPAGLGRVAVTGRLLRVALPWLLRPTQRRSRAVLRLMSASGHDPADDQVEWMTLVARHTRTTGAPGPAPRWATEAWRPASTSVITGAEDCFFPPHRLDPLVRERLGAELVVVPGVGHLSVDEAPTVLAGHIVAAAGSMVV